MDCLFSHFFVEEISVFEKVPILWKFSDIKFAKPDMLKTFFLLLLVKNKKNI
jgi:hypothetical protein